MVGQPISKTRLVRAILSDTLIADANSGVIQAGGGLWVSSPDEGTVYRLSLP
jgi:hypothetical protein